MVIVWLNVNGNSVTYYDNFVVQYIPKWVIKTEKQKHLIFRIMI